MNTCTFTGRVVANAEIRTTPNGTSLCKFRFASDTGWGDSLKTHWLDCVIFGNRGTSLQPHLLKGEPLTVVGDLEPPRTYESKEGETRVSQSLVVREVALQGGKKDGAPAAKPASQAPQGAPQGAPEPQADFDDDLPF